MLLQEVALYDWMDGRLNDTVYCEFYTLAFTGILVFGEFENVMFSNVIYFKRYI